MLRGLGLTLLCLAAIAGPAQAGDRGRAVDGSGVSAQEGTTTATMQTTMPQQAEAARVSGVPASAPSAPRSGSAGGFRRELLNRPVEAASLLPQRREADAVRFPWLRQGRLGVPLTDRLLVGLRYRHLEGEDLWPEFADTGAAGYDSHHILIRASWRF